MANYGVAWRVFHALDDPAAVAVWEHVLAMLRARAANTPEPGLTAAPSRTVAFQFSEATRTDD